MKKDIIVFISWVPPTLVMADQIKISAFKRAGYRVIYLNLAKYYFPENWHKYCSSNKEYIVKADFIYDCKDKKEILDWIKKESGRAWFWVLHRLTYFELKDVWLFRIFKKYNCDYFLVNPAPVFSLTDFATANKKQLFVHIINRCFGLLRKFRFKKFFQKISHWLICWLIYHGIFLQTPKYFFVAGKVFEKKIELLFPKTKVIKIPSYDYVRAMRAMKGKIQDELIDLKPYNVYIDHSIFNAPDAKLLNFKTIGREVFLDKINKFFERLEKITGKQIIIAASSKSKYTGQEFNNRKIFYGLTSEAVYHSNMTISHISTANNFAIIFKKPLLLLSFSEFSERVKDALDKWAKALKKKILNVDEKFNLKMIDDLSAVNPEVYNSYFQNYIYSPGAPLLVAETIIQKLKNG